jgi:hypothetical protein
MFLRLNPLLFFILLFIVSHSPLFASDCEKKKEVLDFLKLNKTQFIKKVTDYSRTNGKEFSLNVSDINQARSLAFNNSVFKELGFDWTTSSSYQSRLPLSDAFGKKVGVEVHDPKSGSLLRIRLDWDEGKGAHYNVEITHKENQVKVNTLKYAVGFLCGERKCSKDEYSKFIFQLNTP